MGDVGNTTVGLREQGKSQDRGQFTWGGDGLSTKPFSAAAFPALSMDKDQHISGTRFDPKKPFKHQKSKALFCWKAHKPQAQPHGFGPGAQEQPGQC